MPTVSRRQREPVGAQAVAGFVGAMAIVLSTMSGCTTDDAPPPPVEATSPAPTTAVTPAPHPVPSSSCEPFRPLAAVDHGSTEGAAGTVTTDASGAPVTYRVVAGDTLNDIILRFGLGQCGDGHEQLQHLNAGWNGDLNVFVDETFLLAPADR